MRPYAIPTPRGERVIGAGYPVFVVAELSGNHNQDLERALLLIDRAAEAGADAIKLQTYTADSLTIDSDEPYFRVTLEGAWKGETLYQLYQRAATPWDWHPALVARAHAHGLPLFSTPFDEAAVDFLESLQVPLYKVASLEIGDLALLRAIGRTGKPVILSKGAATEPDIVRAIQVLRAASAGPITVLQCVSAYPALPSETNLNTIVDLQKRFGVQSGLSDHTLGVAVPIAAAALGANVIEKHLTLRRADGGPDSEFSLEPEEFAEMVRGVRTATDALGQPQYEVQGRAALTAAYRRSLFVVADVKGGEVLTAKHVRAIRPGHGLSPEHLEAVLGKRAARDLRRGTPLVWEDVEGLAQGAAE